MEKVFTGDALTFCISATIVEESTPPERKTPSGTSAVIRILVASLKSSSRYEIASSADPSYRSSTARRVASATDQYEMGSCAVLGSDSFSTSLVPGGSLQIPR